jgi:predicted nucleotidyltransferase
MEAPLKFFDILKVLTRHGVDFILVGGVAAILEGAPVSTFDLDIMVQPTSEDRDRLLEALRDLNARYLDSAGRHILPDRRKLETLHLQRLLTDFGPLDVLERIGDGLRYPDLVEETQIYEVGGLSLRVLRLEAIIRSKEQAGREKDLAALPVLRRTLRLKRGEAPNG